MFSKEIKRRENVFKDFARDFSSVVMSSDRFSVLRMIMERKISPNELLSRSENNIIRKSVAINKTLKNAVEEAIEALRLLGIEIKSFNDLINKLLQGFILSLNNGNFEIDKKELTVRPTLLFSIPRRIKNNQQSFVQINVEEKDPEREKKLREISNFLRSIANSMYKIIDNKNLDDEIKLQKLEELLQQAVGYRNHSNYAKYIVAELEDKINKLQKKIKGLDGYIK